MHEHVSLFSNFDSNFGGPASDIELFRAKKGNITATQNLTYTWRIVFRGVDSLQNQELFTEVQPVLLIVLSYDF